MSKISIRSKLIAIIALLLLAMAGLGALAVHSVQVLNGHTVQIAKTWLPSVRYLGELRSAINLNRAQLRAYAMVDNNEDRVVLDKKMKASFSLIAHTRDSYMALLSSPKERELFENWSRSWTKYVEQTKAIVDLSRKGDGSSQETNRIFVKVIRPIADESDGYLKEAIALNDRGADTETKSAANSYTWTFAIICAVLLITVVMAALAGLLLIRDISASISSVVRPMQALGRGDLAVDIPRRGEKTEIGSMADALQIFKDALIAKKAADEEAASDAQVKIERAKRLDELTTRFEHAIGEIVETVSEASSGLESSADSLTQTADRSRELATFVTSASEEASANVQSVASATEELSSSVSEISRQVQESAQIAKEAVTQAHRTNEHVSELSKAAARIGDVIELINTIAGQTNLLALNATIEAARAGDAGRGFAVVASEVKALAEQTARATGEIDQQISGIQAATQESVGAIKLIGSTIERLSDISSAIAAAVEQQGAATQEIARNVQHAAEGTQQVSSNITEVQRGAVATGSASSQVLSAAQSLAQDSSRLKSEVVNFISAVRVA